MKITPAEPNPAVVASSAANADATPENQVQRLIDRLREIYRKNLSKSATARTALGALGFTDAALLDRYGIGYSDGTLPKMLPTEPTLRNQLKQLGVVDENGAECLTGCIIFPVDDADGRRVTLWACPVDGPAPSRLLLNRRIPLWNAAVAKQASQLFVFEDPVEALSAAAAGFTNVSALDPEAGEPDQKAIVGWGVPSVSVIVPATPAGTERGRKIQARLQPLKSQLVCLPNCTGLNSMLREKGPKVLAAAIVAASHGLEALEIPGMVPRTDGLDFMIGDRHYRVRGLQAGPQKLSAVISLEHAGRLHLDKVELLSSRSRKEFVREVVRLFTMPADHIEADLGKLIRACELRVTQSAGAGAPAPLPGTISEADRNLGEAFGRDPRLIELILADYAHCGLIGERANKLLSYLTMSSRKLPRPLAVLTVATSGAGKSALQEVTVSFCPPDETEKITIISGKALFHKERDSIKHKLIAFQEAEGARQADYALRVLISEGELTNEVTAKVPGTGKLTTVRNKVEGPVAVLLTTTSLALNPETISRFFVTSVNDSREQTRAIQTQQRREHTLEGLAEEQGRSAILSRHHAFQRLLQPVRVVNPLIEAVEFDDDRVSARRELPKRLRLIQAIAFVRQLQKPVKHLGPVPYIEVDATDLTLAHELVRELFANHLAELSPVALALLNQLATMRAELSRGPLADPATSFTFTCRQVRDFTGTPHSSLQRHLKELSAFEFIIRDGGHRGQTCHYRLDWDESATCPAPAHRPADPVSHYAART